MSRDATTSFAHTLVDEWARAGITHAVVAPGSRSTPLALALAAEPRIAVHVLFDERSAGGFALGIGRATGRPAVLVCTSGTAAALFHGAVLEAHHGRVPLVVCTADRPPELRDVGAGQTIEQARLYGAAVRWAHDPGPPDDRPDVGDVWRHLAARAVASASGPPAGPVHLNLPFREPLVPTGESLVPAPGRAGGAPFVSVQSAPRVLDDASVESLARQVRSHPRGVIVAGWGAAVEPETAERFATAAGWPILADPLSGLRSGPSAISTYDAFLRDGASARHFEPEAVVRLGAAPTSKSLGAWLDRDIATWLVDPDDAWLDPSRATTTRIVADAEPLLAAIADVLEHDGAPNRGWLDEWCTVEGAARRALDEVCDGDPDPFEGRIARDVVATVPDGTTVVVASSMPVRDLESFAAPRTGVRFVANRGVNGIDGFVGTALGVASASEHRPVVALVGDLCFLHDQNALVRCVERGIDVTFVVVDNDGGGIFSFLPQSDDERVDVDDFRTLFATPHGVDIARIAALHDVPCVEVEKANAFAPTLEEAIRAGGVQIVLVRTDRDDNVARHRAVWSAVADAATSARP
jgi:2-succinyl-5-enolpyruvyl-6-hydroxy-3-cyclohexene-1-carboxylate synthase